MIKKISTFLLAVMLIFACAFSAYATGDDTEILPGRDFPHGDVNLDMRVSIKDVTLIRKYLAVLSELADFQISLADVDGTKGVSIKDATYIQKFIAGLVSELFVPEQTTSVSATTETPASEIVTLASTAAVTEKTEVQTIATQAEQTTVLATDATEATTERATDATEYTEVTEVTEATEATTKDPHKPVQLPFVPAS